MTLFQDTAALLHPSPLSASRSPLLSLQVFDVRPLWGELQPGESEQVTFTFFGHANIVARVRALCHVQGGPTYEVVLAGEASCPSYQLDVEEIDWGLQVPQAAPATAPCLASWPPPSQALCPSQLLCWLWGLGYNL